MTTSTRPRARALLACVFSLTLTATLSSCSNSPADVPGTLRLPLQATTASGNVYRLRNATFQVTGGGATFLTLSSETLPPTAPTLVSTLPVGAYNIQLNPGWTLARVTATGEQTVAASLVSSSALAFNIQDQQQTTVTFTFETDGTTVVLGEGTLGVNVVVNERDGGTASGFLLTVMTSGNGTVTSSDAAGTGVAGINCNPASTTSDCSQSYPSGTSVTLNAAPALGGSFLGWSGDCAPAGGAAGGTTATVVMSANRNCTAMFSGAGGGTSFLLTVATSGNGTVTSSDAAGTGVAGINCNPASTTSDCSQSYPSGTSVTLNAAPALGGSFLGWSGDCVPAGGAAGGLTATVLMSANRNCTAMFSGAGTTTSFLLTVMTSGNGTVTSDDGAGTGVAGINCNPASTTSDCSQSYPSGTSVTLNAAPALGGSFLGWSGDCVPAGGAAGGLTATVLMSANRNCTAAFSAAGGGTTTMPMFAGAGAGAEGTGDLTIPYPAGVTPGQLLVLQLGSRSGNLPATPAGWTAFSFDENPNTRQRLYLKTAVAGEPATLAVVMGTSNVNVGRMYAFSGVRAGVFTEASTVVLDDALMSGPTVATTGPRRLVVAFVALDNNPALAPIVGATGGTWSEAVGEFGSAIGSNFSLQLQVVPMPLPGTVMGGEANLGGGGDASVCRAFALIGN